MKYLHTTGGISDDPANHNLCETYLSASPVLPELVHYLREVSQQSAPVKERRLVRFGMKLRSVKWPLAMAHGFDLAVLTARENVKTGREFLHFTVVGAPHGHHFRHTSENGI